MGLYIQFLLLVWEILSHYFFKHTLCSLVTPFSFWNIHYFYFGFSNGISLLEFLHLKKKNLSSLSSSIWTFLDSIFQLAKPLFHLIWLFPVWCKVFFISFIEFFSLQCGRPGFNPWVGKIPWRRERLHTPVFWPGEFHGVAKSQTWLSDFHFHCLYGSESAETRTQATGKIIWFLLVHISGLPWWLRQ